MYMRTTLFLLLCFNVSFANDTLRSKDIKGVWFCGDIIKKTGNASDLYSSFSYVSDTIKLIKYEDKFVNKQGNPISRCEQERSSKNEKVYRYGTFYFTINFWRKKIFQVEYQSDVSVIDVSKCKRWEIKKKNGKCYLVFQNFCVSPKKNEYFKIEYLKKVVVDSKCQWIKNINTKEMLLIRVDAIK